MTKRLGHGLIVMAITLAVVGAIATSTEQGPSEAVAATGSELPQLQSETYVALSGARFDIPIRSGRLRDNVIAEGPTPRTVRVAGIGLEASVISVGVDENNQFAVPAADTVGWYQHGAAPGAAGATVLAAHVDFGGVPGAFFNLKDVLPGDTLELELSDGSVMRYVVTGNTQYDKTELPASELFRKDGDPVLQLITCGGTFDPEQRSYEANVVVTAKPLTA